jgi:hypothetical protein
MEAALSNTASVFEELAAGSGTASSLLVGTGDVCRVRRLLLLFACVSSSSLSLAYPSAGDKLRRNPEDFTSF